MVTYVLLSGLSPFLGDSDQETYNNISACDYTLEEEQFDTVSPAGRRFIQECLVVAPTGRLTAEAGLQHCWIRGEPAHQVPPHALQLCNVVYCRAPP